MDEKRLEELREATVLVILDLRAQYLANGAKALSHWDQISERMQAAIRITSTVDAWVSRVMRMLQIQAPSSALSSSIEVLRDTVTGAHVEWRRLVETESGALIASARREAERRREMREASAATPTETTLAG